MYKVGICGHFGKDKEFLDGQTIKTKTLAKVLIHTYGEDQVKLIDTYGWKKKMIHLVIECIRLVKECDNVIILPAHNGVKIFVPLFDSINKLYRKKLHYSVIGGWLPQLIQKNPKLIKKLNRFYSIQVETDVMVKDLTGIGMQHVYKVPNFKILRILNENELIFQKEPPYHLCMFSRITPLKGIENAIKTVHEINEKFGKLIYKLDIYGWIDDDYLEQFNKYMKAYGNEVSYEGCVTSTKSVEVIKKYHLLLFPTEYRTEGIPGTIIDAYYAGVPVVASTWNSATEIVIHNETGILYDFDHVEGLKKSLLLLKDQPDLVHRMKYACLKQAKNYSPEYVTSIITRYL
ncbi:MAG: glycoside hydrolase [Firmicutes bacterium HGW-Firmicutes-5]|nr:MAG: glycoside hydrolase [Firmicutes bacterium HGW-Firmicutes-5]